MRLLVRIVSSAIEEALCDLPEEWRIDASAPAGRVNGRGALPVSIGAWVDFYGIVREMEDPAHRCGPERPPEGASVVAHSSQPFEIRALRYEAHEAMAIHQMTKILERLGEAHDLSAALVLHRVGEVEVGEASLLVRMLTPHREEALRATIEFIDELKRVVPIWKHAVPR